MTQTKVAQALVRVFLNDQYVKNLAKHRSQSVETPIKTAVIGAGIMGGGIAYQSARKGIPIIMKDINEKSVQLSMNEAKKLLNKQFERKQITALEVAKIWRQLPQYLTTLVLKMRNLLLKLWLRMLKSKRLF